MSNELVKKMERALVLLDELSGLVSASCDAELAALKSQPGAIYAVFDGPPGPECGRFVEEVAGYRYRVHGGPWELMDESPFADGRKNHAEGGERLQSLMTVDQHKRIAAVLRAENERLHLLLSIYNEGKPYAALKAERDALQRQNDELRHSLGLSHEAYEQCARKVDVLREENERLKEHCVRLGKGDAERYWEGRWRDSDAELQAFKGVVVPDILIAAFRAMDAIPRSAQQFDTPEINHAKERVIEVLRDLLAAAPQPVEKAQEFAHPEDTCQRCGGPNIVWFADSALWNAYASDADILCPICFAKAAESKGFVPPAWVISPEQAERQEPIAYLRASNLDRLAQRHVAGCAVSLSKSASPGYVAVYTAPQPAQDVSGLVEALKTIAVRERKWRLDDVDDMGGDEVKDSLDKLSAEIDTVISAHRAKEPKP